MNYTQDSFSCRWHERLSGIVWTLIRFVTLQYTLYRDRRDATSLRYRNRAEITILVSEQKPYIRYGLALYSLYTSKNIQKVSTLAWPLHCKNFQEITSFFVFNNVLLVFSCFCQNSCPKNIFLFRLEIFERLWCCVFSGFEINELTQVNIYSYDVCGLLHVNCPLDFLGRR